MNAIESYLSSLPLRTLIDAHNTSIELLEKIRDEAVFNIGDELVNAERYSRRSFFDQPLQPRFGKLIAIDERPIVNGSQRPTDFIKDGKPHMRFFYIACIGPGWKRTTAVNHTWAICEQPLDKCYSGGCYFERYPNYRTLLAQRDQPNKGKREIHQEHIQRNRKNSLPVEIRSTSYHKILRAIELTFRGSWYKKELWSMGTDD